MSNKNKQPLSSSPCAMADFPEYSGLDDVSGSPQEHDLEIQSSNTIIYCDNWKACCHFYVNILRLEVAFSKDDWFHELRISANCHLSIADQSRCSIPAARGNGLTLSFFVEKLEAWHAFFHDQGIETTPVKTNSWRAPFFFVRDPDNNRIEFWTREL